jgi:diguanylate cyclase (GGDEF)-like protein
MVCLPRLAAPGLAALLVSLALPAPAAPAGPLPDLPAPPPLPGNPSVGVAPGGGGATVDAAVGDTTLQVGAGTSGASIKRGTRGAGSGSGSSPVDSTPVSIPTLRGGRHASPVATGGGSAVLFGPAAARKTGQRRKAASAPGTTGRTTTGTGTPAAARKARHATSSGDSNTRLMPFFELVQHIPGLIKAGIAALALIALAIWAAWVRTRRRFERNAFVDPITGTANAAAFERILGRELARAKRYKRPLTLLVLDVSYVRQSRVPLLDQTLRDVTRAIQEELRPGDIVGRLGESRFAVICAEATATAGATFARALESRLEKMRVHAVVGTAERQPTDLGPREIMARAVPEPTSSDAAATAAAADRRRALLKVA